MFDVILKQHLARQEAAWKGIWSALVTQPELTKLILGDWDSFRAQFPNPCDDVPSTLNQISEFVLCPDREALVSKESAPSAMGSLLKEILRDLLTTPKYSFSSRVPEPYETFRLHIDRSQLHSRVYTSVTGDQRFCGEERCTGGCGFPGLFLRAYLSSPLEVASALKDEFGDYVDLKAGTLVSGPVWVECKKWEGERAQLPERLRTDATRRMCWF